MIIYGKKIFGRMERVANLFCVGTLFFHVYFLPLIPIVSVISQRGNDGLESGIQIPLQIKSVLLAWSRGALFVGFVVIAIFDCITDASQHHQFMVGVYLAFPVAWIILLLVSRISHPTFERACQLGSRIDLRDEQWEILFNSYGRAWEGREAMNVRPIGQPSG